MISILLAAAVVGSPFPSTGNKLVDDLVICAVECKTEYDACLEHYQKWACRISYRRCLKRCTDEYEQAGGKPPPGYGPTSQPSSAPASQPASQPAGGRAT